MFIDLESPQNILDPTTPGRPEGTSDRTTTTGPGLDIKAPQPAAASSRPPGSNAATPQTDAVAASTSASDAVAAIPVSPEQATIPQPGPAGPLNVSRNQMFTSADMPDGNSGPSSTARSFTDMEFSLAPTGPEALPQEPSQSTDFDLSAFAPADGESNMLSLDGLLPDGEALPEPGLTTVQAPQSQMDEPEEATHQPAQDTSQQDADMFDLDGVTSLDHGLDVDLDLGNAGDVSNFDDLFFGTENGQLGLDDMDDKAFDNDFFGL